MNLNLTRATGFFIILILSIVSLSFFLSNFFASYPWNGRYHITDPDSQLFLRYYEQSLLRGELIRKDTYGTFPDEVENNFPPFHLQLLLKVTYLFYAIWPEYSGDTDMIIGWLPPLFGWITSFFFIYFTWKQTGNFGLTAMVAFFCVPGPVSAMTSRFLLVDYQFLNSFYIWSWLFLAWHFISFKKSWAPILAAFVTFLFIMTWSGTPLFFGMATAYGWLLWLFDDEKARSYLEYAALTMIVGAVLTSIYLINEGCRSLKFSDFGWFQPVCIFVGGIFSQLLYYEREKARLGFLARFVVSIFSLFLICTVAYIVFPGQFSDSFSFFNATDPVMASISELAPLIKVRKLFSQLNQVFTPALKFGLGFILFPLFAFYAPEDLYKRGGGIFRDWIVILVFMAVYKVRFARWLAIGTSLYTGVVVYILVRFGLEKLSKESARVRLAKVACLFLFVSIFVFLNFFPVFSLEEYLTKSQIEALNWIERNTPTTSGYSDFKKPEYGICCFWDEGNMINYFSRRPTISNNALWGFKKMADVFTARTEEEALRYLHEYKARYIYISFRGFFDGKVNVLDYYKSKSNVDRTFFSYSPDYKPGPAKEHRYADTFHYWIANNCAIKPSGKFLTPSSHLRIVFSSEQTSPLVAPVVLIYEVVKGARVAGTADPGTEVVISLGCQFSLVSVVYKKTFKVDENGNFEAVVPYPSGYKGGRVITEPFYKLLSYKDGKPVKSIAYVKEADVINGRKVIASEIVE